MTVESLELEEITKKRGLSALACISGNQLLRRWQRIVKAGTCMCNADHMRIMFRNHHQRKKRNHNNQFHLQGRERTPTLQADSIRRSFEVKLFSPTKTITQLTTRKYSPTISLYLLQSESPTRPYFCVHINDTHQLFEFRFRCKRLAIIVVSHERFFYRVHSTDVYNHPKTVNTNYTVIV